MRGSPSFSSSSSMRRSETAAGACGRSMQISASSVDPAYPSDEMILVQDFKLDLYELVYTEVVLAMPSKHLCTKDCKGLCFKCGKNLNDGPCGCATKEVDPRLKALAELLEN